MGDIGEPVRHIELEPLREDSPVKEPAAPSVPAPTPEREPEQVPA